MKRQYYISNDLEDLKAIEQELSASGLSLPQFHVLSENDAEVEKHHLHAIEAVLKKDVVRSTELGAVFGVILAAIVLGVTYAMGWHQSVVGWLPFGFLAIVIIGFSTWEGGLIGIQMPHYQFKRFQKLLAQGEHVFFVDVTSDQELVVEQVMQAHPSLRHAGTDEATPAWVVKGQEKFTSFMKTMP